jgi:hypothetical protein
MKRNKIIQRLVEAFEGAELYYVIIIAIIAIFK